MKKPRLTPVSRVIWFVIFLGFLALFLKAMGWCVGGICEVGADYLLK